MTKDLSKVEQEILATYMECSARLSDVIVFTVNELAEEHQKQVLEALKDLKTNLENIYD